MIKLIELINEQLNQLFFKQVAPEYRGDHYYELHITCDVVRSVKIIRFDSVKDLMDYVHQNHLMYDPSHRYAMIQTQASGEKHILQLNKVPHGNSQTAIGVQDATELYQVL